MITVAFAGTVFTSQYALFTVEAGEMGKGRYQFACPLYSYLLYQPFKFILLGNEAFFLGFDKESSRFAALATC
jgi:hypothetical protein